MLVIGAGTTSAVEETNDLDILIILLL